MTNRPQTTLPSTMWANDDIHQPRYWYQQVSLKPLQEYESKLAKERTMGIETHQESIEIRRTPLGCDPHSGFSNTCLRNWLIRCPLRLQWFCPMKHIPIPSHETLDGWVRSTVWEQINHHFSSTSPYVWWLTPLDHLYPLLHDRRKFRSQTSKMEKQRWEESERRSQEVRR